MTELFSERFKTISSDEELDDLCIKFPQYDRAYLCQASYVLRKKTREWMEGLWKDYEPYADSHFLKEFRYQFTQRAWELYLGTTLLSHGFILGTRKDTGPDFSILIDKKTVWIEAIAVTKGIGPDRVPDVMYNGVCTVPTDEIVLRLSNALNIKFQKYVSDCKNGYVKYTDPYVIALDRSQLEHPDAMLPNILKALFGIGNLALRMRVNGKPSENPESFWTHQPVIIKKNGNPISMHFFDDLDHSGISAVIYSKDGIINSPRIRKEMGENLFIVHNHNAKNPLPHGFFPFGEEYVVEQGYVKKIRNNKTFTSPNPFEFGFE